MRVAFGELYQETDTFSPVRTGIESFEAYGLYQGSELLDRLIGVGPIGGFLEIMREHGIDCELFPLSRAWAAAGGIILQTTFEQLLNMLIVPLRASMPLDGVFLSLCGAAVAERDDDVEGAVLEAVRSVIGPDVLVVVSLDHHANITSRMVNSADMLVGHETQPHDTFATGRKSARLFFNCLNDVRRPMLAWRKIPMITPQDQFLTSHGPMKDWFDRARSLEKISGVMDVSPYPMQPWLDVKEAGWSVVVHTNDDQSLAEELAEELANQAWSDREAYWKSDRVSPSEAVGRAYAAEKGLVVLADTGDAVYGGAPGDSTCLLKEFLAQAKGQTAIILLPMVDPVVVEAAFGAGIGAWLDLEVGARLDNVFSSSAAISAEVVAISENYCADLGERGTCELGRTGLLRIGNIQLAVVEQNVFAINYPVLYTHLGIDLNNVQAVVVKTASNFQHFRCWQHELIRVDSPGMTQSRLSAFEWAHVPRPLYPFDAQFVDWQA